MSVGKVTFKRVWTTIELSESAYNEVMTKLNENDKTKKMIKADAGGNTSLNVDDVIFIKQSNPA